MNLLIGGNSGDAYTLLASAIAAGHFPADGVPAVALLAVAALPGTAIKQMVNVVQMRTAMALLVAHDQGKAR